MIRVILINMFFLLLPSILYFSYIYLRQNLQPNEPVRAEPPLAWLVAGGVVLMLASLLMFGKWEGHAPGGKYHPPVVRDGVLIPGHVE